MKILLAGDLVITKQDQEYFESGRIENVIGNEMIQLLSSMDYRIVNLEAPLYDEDYPELKFGPNLRISTKSIEGIKKINPSLVLLANNHIMDYGREGMASTIKLLSKCNIPCIGVGENLNSIQDFYVLEKNNSNVCVYNVSDKEFGIATESLPGMNSLDLVDIWGKLEELKEKYDYLIVVYHGGKEHYRYPTPFLKKICRKMVDCGSDLVVSQHSHCVGSMETYNNSVIVYGQGNFIFNELGKESNEFWNNGLLLKVEVTNEMKVDFVPFFVKNSKIQIARGVNEKKILLPFFERSKRIDDDVFIRSSFDDFSREQLHMYLSFLGGYGKWMRRIDKKIFNGYFIKRRYSKQRLLPIKNFMECNAHREVLLNAVNQEINEIKKRSK